MKVWISRISIIVSAVSLVTLVLARIFIGGWIYYFWWPLGLFLIGLIINLVIDFKKYLKFLTLKTSRHGMTLGLSVLIMLAIVSSIGYLSSNWNYRFDVTEEKLNSLSLQTRQVLDSMKDSPIHIKLFYKGKIENSDKIRIKEDIFKPFTQYSSLFKLEFIDAYKQNRLAQEYLSNVSAEDSVGIFAFLEYEEKKVQIREPISEETILSGLVQVSRRKEKTIYYTVGHQERDFFGSHGEGVEEFRKALEESSFNLSEWNFVTEKKPLPEDAAALLILGPTKPFFEKEIEWVGEYIDRNGKVFIALDPGRGHNLTPFLESQLDILFKDNFVFSVSSILANSSAVFGARYDSQSPITRSFDQYFRGQLVSFFDEVSEVDIKENHSWMATHLVYSDPVTYVQSSLNSDPGQQQYQSRVLGVLMEEYGSQKNSSEEDEESKEKIVHKGFKAVVFGDSDFLTNRNFYKGIHRDLALNIVTYLANENDLISIRPKTPKNTQVILTSTHRIILFLFALIFPLFFIVLAFISWTHRNRA